MTIQGNKPTFMDRFCGLAFSKAVVHCEKSRGCYILKAVIVILKGVIMKILIVIVALFVSHSVYADKWLATKEGCQVWIAIPQPNETVSWTGACVDGKSSGKGIVVSHYSEDGVQKSTRYKGEMREGKFNGQGTLFYNSGNRYEGEWKNQQMHGQGLFYWADGHRYEGEWKNNQQHGQGTFYAANGNRFDGEWKEGQLNGQGTAYYADGTRYEGKFINDMAADGICYFTDGSVSYDCYQKPSGRWVRK